MCGGRGDKAASTLNEMGHDVLVILVWRRCVRVHQAPWLCVLVRFLCDKVPVCVVLCVHLCMCAFVAAYVCLLWVTCVCAALCG